MEYVFSGTAVDPVIVIAAQEGVIATAAEQQIVALHAEGHIVPTDAADHVAAPGADESEIEVEYAVLGNGRPTDE